MSDVKLVTNAISYSQIDAAKPASVAVDDQQFDPVHSIDSSHAVHQKELPDYVAGGNSVPDQRQAKADAPKEEAPAENVVAVDQAVSDVRDYFQQVQRELNFDVDRASGRTVIKVTDANTGDVVRQFPSETVLKIAEAIKANQDTDSLKGLLFSDQA